MAAECSFVYVTTANAEEAETIGAAMVEQRLAACANIIDGVRSIYWWQGNLESDSETILILKTRSDLVANVIDAVKAKHSYDCPDILEWPVRDGNVDFLSWIAAETRS